MTLTRREFNRLSLALPTLGGSIFLAGCPKDADVWHEIEKWVPTGIDAFDSVLFIVDPLITPAIEAVAVLVKAGFADLASAIDSYLAAPAADKATWAQKVQLILTDISANFQKFLTDIGQSGNPLIKTIVLLVQVIVDTIAGFINQIMPAGVARAFSAQFRIGTDVISVHPTRRDRKAFIAAFNGECDTIGRAELHIPHAVPLNRPSLKKH